MDQIKPTQAARALNEGHGHVYLRPDGRKVRCGGPNLCPVCSSDLAQLQTGLTLLAPSIGLAEELAKFARHIHTYGLDATETGNVILSLQQASVALSQQDAMLEALQWWHDRRFALQAKFDLHGPADLADAMRTRIAADTAILARAGDVS